MQPNDSAAVDSGGNPVDNLRMLRVLRALRLIKLTKLITGLRVIKRWEVKIAINYSALSYSHRVAPTQGSRSLPFVIFFSVPTRPLS